jgi:hypothetical protein
MNTNQTTIMPIFLVSETGQDPAARLIVRSLLHTVPNPEDLPNLSSFPEATTASENLGTNFILFAWSWWR